ncbi:PBS lyase HEAT-like repeat domain-containing protein [Synechococcus sp. A18-25c]|uniref:HEAT repeat domain-containing protein n=1 Tax=Synechococcus sp. A18-25c TaxID=1866938 RepID=UPI001647C69D|nr:HEAT repeat domain-containing protein [Synechococcus sp. A18-25c]QNJ19044.1 PBS lyase HEAT-like repeat domain-containing protein [Synechococcus sp. A18-25c]
MRDSSGNHNEEPRPELAIDPDVLARELEAELVGDPLDEIAPDDPEGDALEAVRSCDAGLEWLKQGHDQKLQGLRVFCEHRDPRAVPLLLPLLGETCPVVRMSAVYALGRNPSTQAVQALLTLLQVDSNAYVRKATAWSLGNYSDAPVLNPLIRALQVDVAAVRLWASVSLAEAGSTSPAKADLAAGQLLLSLKIDSEPVVRSNCIWALGRLHDMLVKPRQEEVVECFVAALLKDPETAVRDEARTALEQLDNPDLVDRLQTLLDEGLLL